MGYRIIGLHYGVADHIQSGTDRVKDGNPTFVSGGDIAEYDFTIVRFGLKGWKNYLLNGTEAVFETRKERIGDQEVDVPTDKTLSMIPLFAIHELAMEIWGSNNVNEDLRKN